MFPRLCLVLALLVFAPFAARAEPGAAYYIGSIKINVAGVTSTSMNMRIYKNRLINGLITLNNAKTVVAVIPFAGSLNGPNRYRATIIRTNAGIIGQFSGGISKDKKTIGGKGALRLANGKKPAFQVKGRLIPLSITRGLR